MSELYIWRWPVATVMTLLCDRCGKKRDVSTINLKSSVTFTSDLCVTCFKSLVKEYGFKELIKSSKATKVWDFEDIPRNTR